MALGLISSETIQGYWMRNTRRRIFHDYPNGTAPLTGLLSLQESEDTPIPEFGWQEKRWQAMRTTSVAGPNAAGSKSGPFATAGSSTQSGDTNGNFDLAQFASLRVYVADGSVFRENQVVKLFRVGTGDPGPAASGTVDVSGRVLLVQNTAAPHYIEISVLQPYANLLNVAAVANNLELYVIGTAYAEGAGTGGGRIKFPYEAANYTQIFKTAFELSRTALKAPLTYDKSGVYEEALSDNGIDHLAQLEFAAFFGERSKTTKVDSETGDSVSLRTTGGLRWYLDQWEKGSIANGGAIDYGQPNVYAESDWRTFTNKRVLKLAGATITKADFNEINSRVFEKTNASDWSKLCLCGPGYLNKVTDMFERSIQFTSLRESTHKGFDFELVKHNSNSGTVYYKTHPLFNDPLMRNSAFYLDLGYLGYRPLSDSDTDIQQMVQNPGADKRKDQWLTEAGFEVRFPEAHMYVENLGGISLT